MEIEIELETDGGFRKKVRLMGVFDGWALIWWPGCGMYDLGLTTGNLMQPGEEMWREPHQWHADEATLANLRNMKKGPV